MTVASEPAGLAAALVAAVIAAASLVAGCGLDDSNAGRPPNAPVLPATAPNAAGAVATIGDAERALESSRTRVVRILPTAATWPENLTRLHVEFSSSMSEPPVTGAIRVINHLGSEVAGALEPEDNPWNAARTRFSWRLANHEGSRSRAFQSGRTYTIAVDQQWLDHRSEPLEAAYRQVVTVGPADRDPVSLGRWRIAAPRANRPDPLVVTFPEPLDPDLLDRSLGVASRAGAPVPGRMRIDPGERQWYFRPDAPWRAGGYHLVVLSDLKDLAGNPMIDPSGNAPSEPKSAGNGPTHYRLSFEVR